MPGNGRQKGKAKQKEKKKKEKKTGKAKQKRGPRKTSADSAPAASIRVSSEKEQKALEAAITTTVERSNFLHHDEMTDWDKCNIYYKSIVTSADTPEVVPGKGRVMPSEKKIINAINNIYTVSGYTNIEEREKKIEKIFNTIVYYIMGEPNKNFQMPKKKGKEITREDIIREIINKTARYINQTILKREAEYGIHKPADNYLKINDELKNGTAVDTAGVSGGSRGNIETGHTNAQCKNGALMFPYSMSDNKRTHKIKPNSKPDIPIHTPNWVLNETESLPPGVTPKTVPTSVEPEINFPTDGERGENQQKYSIPRYKTDQGFKDNKYKNADGTLKYKIKCYQCLFNLTHGDGINNDGCQCEHKKAIGQNAVTEGLLLEAYYQASLIVLDNSNKNNNQLYRWSLRRQRVAPILVDHAHTACNYAKSNNSLILQKLNFQRVGDQSSPIEITYATDSETKIQVNGLVNLCLGLEGSKMLVNKSEKGVGGFESKPRTSWAYVVGSKLKHPAISTEEQPYLRCFLPRIHPDATNEELYKEMVNYGELYFPNKSTSGPSNTVGAKITNHLSEHLTNHVKFIIGELKKSSTSTPSGEIEDMDTNECTLCSLVVNFHVIFLNTKKPPIINKMSPNIINALKQAIYLGYQVRNLPSTAGKHTSKKKTSKKKTKQKGGMDGDVIMKQTEPSMEQREPSKQRGHLKRNSTTAGFVTPILGQQSLTRADTTVEQSKKKRVVNIVEPPTLENLPDILRTFLIDLQTGIPTGISRRADDNTVAPETEMQEKYLSFNQSITEINELFRTNPPNHIEWVFLEHYLKVFKNLKSLLLILDGFYKKENNLYLDDLVACKEIYQTAYKDSLDFEKKLVKIFRRKTNELRGGNIGRSPNLHGGTKESKSTDLRRRKSHKSHKTDKLPRRSTRMTDDKYTRYLREYEYKDTNFEGARPLHELDKYIAEIYKNKYYLAYEELLSVESESLEMSTKLDKIRTNLNPPYLNTGWKFLGRECVHFIETLVDCRQYPKGVNGEGLYENFYKDLSENYNINNIYESDSPGGGKRKMKKKKKQTMKKRKKKTMKK